MGGEQERSWTPGKRAAWWFKYAVTVAGALGAIAGGAKILGLRFDLQTVTQARVDHDAIRTDFAASTTTAIEKLSVSNNVVHEKIFGELKEQRDMIKNNQLEIMKELRGVGSAPLAPNRFDRGRPVK